MAGNANSGRKLDKVWTEALRRILYANDRKALEDIARVTIAQAKTGESWAIQEIANRLEGKALQQIESHNINEYVFAEVPKTDTTDEWMKSPGAAVGVSSQAHKPN